ncbi:MAG: hypothetical protein JWP69_1202 [Flaviaesturariibacter sp.]|nr:hypothetical protein [Flaviaesturariibacter sp.]
MNLFLSTHGKTFRAEWQKLKRTGIFWLCLGAALFIPIINTLVGFLMDADPSAENAWGSFLQNNFVGFTGFFFPLFLVITMVRLVYLEHRSDTWKLMETQPVARLSLYIVKYEVALLISLLCLIGLLLFALLGGAILGAAKPDTGFVKSSIPWAEVFGALVRYWIASWALLAIQYFLSLLIKSFAWPMTIGLVAIIAGGMFAGFKVLGWFPYSAIVYTSASYKGSNTGGFLLHHELLSLAWAALFLWLGFQLFIKRGFAAAFIRGGRQLAQTLGVIAIFAILFWIVTKPSVSSPYAKTVLTGTLEMDKLPGEVQLLQAPAFNVVMSGKVANGRFHLSTDNAIPKGIYYLRAGSVRMPVFFGAKDSLHVALTTGKRGTELKFGGTRMAENSFLKEYEPGTGYLQNYGHTLTPFEYSSRVMDRWESEGKEIDRYKTVDNVKPAEDFIAWQKKDIGCIFIAAARCGIS